MKIGYIKEEILKNQFWRGIEIRIFDNNYVIAVSNKKKDRKKVKEKLARIIKKLGIDAVVFSKELEGDFKNDICEMINIKVVNGKKLMEFMEYDIVKYVLDKQNADTKKEDIYIVFKRDSNLNLDFLKDS